MMLSRPEEAILMLQTELFDTMSVDAPVSSWKPRTFIDWGKVAQLIFNTVEDIKKVNL